MPPVAMEVNNLSKKFPGVQALNKVALKLYQGEIHALVGENGAGKSTLISILSGVTKPDSGEIYLFDKIVKIENSSKAKKLRISAVYQELNVVPQMNVAENIFLGQEPQKNKIFIDKKRLYEDAKKELERVGFDIDPHKKVELLSISERQMVEIVRNIALNAKILILDEPTSSLSREEVQKLFQILRVLKNKGISIIYVSHEMEEIIEIADRITVLRNGQNVGTVEKEKTTKNELVKMMAGREINFNISKKKTPRREDQTTLLRIKELKNKKLKNLSFSLFKGEILSILGLVGSGKTELARAIFGMDKIESGKIFLNSKEIKINTPLQAIYNGIGYVTEDRRHDGFIRILSVRDNITLVILKRLAKILGFRDKKKEESLVNDFKMRLSIKFNDINQKTETLSGGNQQKIVLSKWLASESKVLLLDDPTRGVDVSTRQDLYDILKGVAKKKNVGIIIFTSDILEAMMVSDRSLIIRKGKFVSEIMPEEMNYQNLLKIMIGGKTE